MLGNEVLPQPYRFINKLVQRCVDLALEDIVKNLTRGAVIDKKYLPSTMTPVYDLNSDAFSPANDDRLHTITNVVSVYGNHILNTQSPSTSSQHHPDAGSSSLLLGSSSQGRGIGDAFGYIGGGSTSSPNARPPSGNQQNSSAHEGGGAEQLLANSMSTHGGGGVNNAAVFAALTSNMRGKSPLADLLAAQHSAQLAKERKAALQLPMPQAKNITATHVGPQFTIVGTQAGTCAIFETKANQHILTTPILLNPDPCSGDAGPLLARVAESASLGGGEMNSNTGTGATTTAGGASPASGGSGLNLARSMSKNNMKQQAQVPTQGVGLPSNTNNSTASPAGSLPSSPPSGKRGGITSAAHRGASAQNAAAAMTPQSLLSTLPDGVVGVHGGTPLHPQGLHLFAAASATDGIVVFAADSDRISVQPTIPPPRPLPPPEVFAFPPSTPNTNSNAAGSTPLAGERGGGKLGGGLPRSGGRAGSASPVPQSSAARASTPVRNVASPPPAPNEQYQQQISKHLASVTPPPRALYTPLATGLNAEPKEPTNLHVVCKISGLLIASLASDHLKSLGYQGVPSTVSAYNSNLLVGGSSAGAANVSSSPARRGGRNGSGGSSGALGLGNAPGATSSQGSGNSGGGKGGASGNATLQTASAPSAKEKGLSSGGSSNNMSAAANSGGANTTVGGADSSTSYDNGGGADLLGDDPFYSPANASSPAALSRVANAAVPLSRTAFVPSSVKLSPDGTFITVGVDNDSTLLVFDISEEPVDPYLADTVVRVPKYLAAVSCPSSLAGPSVADGSMLRPKALYDFLCDAKGYHLKAGVTEAATAAVIALGGGEGILGDGVVGGMGGGGCGASTRSGGLTSRSATQRSVGVSASERHRVPHQHGAQSGALLEEAEGGPPLLPVNTRAPLPSYTHSLVVAWAGSNAFSRVNLRDDGITSVPQGVLASAGLAAEGGGGGQVASRQQRPFLITTVNASSLQTFPLYSSNNSIDGVSAASASTAAPAPPPTSFTAFSKSNVKVTSQQWSQTLNAMHGPLIAAYTLAARTAGAVASSSASGGGTVGTSSHGSKGGASGGAGGGGGGQRAAGGSIVGGLGASVGRETAASKEAAAAAAAATAQLLGAVTHLSMGATQYGYNGYSSHIAHHVAGLAGIGLGAHVSSLVFGGCSGLSTPSPAPSAVSIGGGAALPRGSSTTILATATVNNGTAATALVPPVSHLHHQQQQHQQHIFAPMPPSAQKDQLLPQIVTTTAIDLSHRLFAVCCQNALTMVFDGETMRFRFYFCDAPHRIHQRSSRQMSCLSAVFQNQDTLTIATVSHGKAYRSFVSVYALNPDAAIRIQPDIITNMRRGEGDAEAASSFVNHTNNNNTNSNLYNNSESKSRHLRNTNANSNSKRTRKSSSPSSAHSSSSDTSSEGDGGEGNKTLKRGLTGLSNTVISRLDMTSRTKIDAAILAKMPGPLEEMLAAFDETRKRNATEVAKSRTRGVHGLRSGVSEEERRRLATVREAMHSNCSMASVNTTALVSSSTSPGSALGMYASFDDDEDSYGGGRGLSSLRNHSSLSFVAPAGGAVGKKAANLLLDSYNGELICKVPYLNDLVFAAPIGEFPILLVRASGRQFIIDMTCGELLGILKDIGRNVFNGKNTPASVYTTAANVFYSNSGDVLSSKSSTAANSCSSGNSTIGPNTLPPAAYLASLLNTEASLLNGTFLTTYAASIGDGSTSGAQQGGAGSVGGVRRGASGGAPNRTALAGAVARRSGSTSQLGTARGTAPSAASASLGLSMSVGRTASVLSSRGSQRGAGGEGKSGGGSFSAATTTPPPQQQHHASLGASDHHLLGTSRGSILYAGSEGSPQGPISVASMAQNCTVALSMMSATSSSACALKLSASQTSTSQPNPVAFVSAASFSAAAAFHHQHHNSSSSSPTIPLSPDTIRRAMCEGPFTFANPKPSTVAFTVKLAASVPRVVLTDSELVVSCDGGWSVQRYPMLPLLWRLYPNLQANFSPPTASSSSTVSPMMSALASSAGGNPALRISPFGPNAASMGLQPSIAVSGPTTALGAKAAAAQRQPASAPSPPFVSDAAAKAAAASFTPPSHFGLSATSPEALALALFYFSHAARIDLIDDYVTADVDKFVASRLGVPPSQVQHALSVANRDHPDKALAHHLASSLLGRARSPYSTASASTRGASTLKSRTKKENGPIPALAQSNMMMSSVIEPRAATSGTVGAHQQQHDPNARGNMSYAGAGANVSWAASGAHTSHSPTRSHAGAASSHSPLPPLTTALAQTLPNVTTKFSELAQQGVEARKKSRGAREARVANAWRTLQSMSASASVSTTAAAAVEQGNEGRKVKR